MFFFLVFKDALISHNSTTAYISRSRVMAVSIKLEM